MTEELLANADSNEDKAAESVKRDDGKKKKSTLREIAEIVAVALVLTIIIKTFIGNYWVPSGSMLPTIEINDKVVVTNFSYWFDGPERGDVVVFHYPLEPKKDYIKRCIGEPGEVIEFKDSKLYVDGVLTAEPYLPEGLEFDDFGPVAVPEGSYFMCGDNRNHSSDSRSWGFVEEKHIVGKAQFVYWPFARWGTL
ncbi:MAG: signal peptidase I [Peptococcaceae bacterium]|nr:signal peptidase I [Peptococcaceae bacterium]